MRTRPLLWRFSLYGFLKNQRYFEPFLILVFMEKGLSFFLIGLLIAFREVTINLFEIPSGAAADVWGRRRSMILSFLAYIASFVVFGLADHLALLFVAMFLFAVGEAFRTGTHKAMIFSWLRNQGREGERTRVYGYTRSWSQFGSALSVVLATLFVLVSDSYTWIFFFSIGPYLLCIVNFLGYPKELDGEPGREASLKKVAVHLKETLLFTLHRPRLRRLVLESAGFEGVFKAVKDYLQPVLAAASLLAMGSLFGSWDLGEPGKAALFVGPVYFLLYVLSGLASRNAHRCVRRCGSEDGAARVLWIADAALFLLLVPALYFDFHPLIIAGFVFLHVLQNLWRPVLVSRFDAQGCETRSATVLSIESQAKTVSTMILAPLLGLAVDAVRAQGPGGAFWPVGAVGLIVAVIFLASPRKK